MRMQSLEECDFLTFVTPPPGDYALRVRVHRDAVAPLGPGGEGEHGDHHVHHR